MNRQNKRQWLVRQSIAFSERKLAKDKNYFMKMDKGQTPELLWIGCADSRVDPAHILDSKPGELFVIRNVANQALPDDSSFQAVLEYSVLHLKVKGIVVCGHSNCGGINATASVYHKLESNLQRALRTLRSDFLALRALNPGKSMEQLQHMMYYQNVRNQVSNLMRVSFVREAVESNQTEILPMLFRLDTGRLEEVV